MPETRGSLNIGHEISVLRATTPRELREKYRQVFGDATRIGNKAHLFKRIAWRLQANAEGGLSERARRRAQELARDVEGQRSVTSLATVQSPQDPEPESARSHTS